MRRWDEERREEKEEREERRKKKEKRGWLRVFYILFFPPLYLSTPQLPALSVLPLPFPISIAPSSSQPMTNELKAGLKRDQQEGEGEG